MKAYNHKAIEKKWQKQWLAKGVYRSKEKPRAKKAYVLDMFPYPSGEGLHVGHPKGYIATDVYSRQKRMQGYSVLHPMGWDAFGLPAENFALKHKVHPRKAVEKNIKRYKEQLGMIGLDYDWSREINTTDPSFYKWTQWIFLQLLKKGLAYQSHEPINWCPSCQTGLANEDLEDGKCERCGSEIERKPMRQWVLKITDYAERMLADLELLPQWQEHIKESQRNWIGKSDGAEIDFALTTGEKVRVFTTRPDTLFGATYLVLAPEHALVEKLKGACANTQEINAYISQAKKRSEIERTAEGKEKTGVKLEGISATNPATKESVPVYIADYVLAHYGTGAIMAVPAHDERDFAFAKRFGLPIQQVVAPLFETREGKDAVRSDKKTIRRKTAFVLLKHWSEDKYLCLDWENYGWHSGIIGGVEDGEKPEEAALREIIEETGYQNPIFVENLGEIHSSFFATHKDVNRYAEGTNLLFRLRDGAWSQPSDEETKNHNAVWVDGGKMDSFLNLPNFVHFWRQLDTSNNCFVDNGVLINSGEYNGLTSAQAKKEITTAFGTKKITYKLRDWVFSRQRYWGEPIPVIHCEKCGVVPVPEKDLPVKLPEVKHYEPSGTGESPLATIEKWVNVKCPKCKALAKRETNTMPQWAGSSWYHLRYMDPKNTKALVDKKKERYWAPVDLYVGGAEHATRHLIYARFWHKFLYDIKAVSTKEPFSRLISVGLIQAEDGRKMSKRFNNVINPDDIIKLYGADTLRLYEMFMGPFTDAIAWNTNSMIGTRRFVEKVWRMQERVVAQDNQALEGVLHKTIKKVGEDIEAFKFNTAISQMMIFVNEVSDRSLGLKQWRAFLQVLAPFAPHITEELWSMSKGKGNIHLQKWPSYNPKKLVADEITMAVQINGKVRAEVRVPVGTAQTDVEMAAHQAVSARLAGKDVLKTIVVPGRLVNFVVREE